jgi:hypothetical protein
VLRIGRAAAIAADHQLPAGLQAGHDHPGRTIHRGAERRIGGQGRDGGG